jgi:hypothetical protein
VVREFELAGIFDGIPSADIIGLRTAMSENMKYSERSEMYCLTISRAIVRTCDGLRREVVAPVCGI